MRDSRLSRLFQAQRSRAEHLTLPVAIRRGRGIVYADHVIDDIHLRKVIPRIVEAQIRRSGDEQRPRRHPQPKLPLLVRIQRQVVRLGAVALEEPGERLPRVHDPEKTGVMDQLLVLVRRGCGRRDEAVLDLAEPLKERLVGLRAERPQDRCLVEADDRERIDIDVPVSDTFVVGDHDRLGARLDFCLRANVAYRQSQQRAGVLRKLLLHAQRADDQPAATSRCGDVAADFQLLNRLAQPEALE